jgi:hypothetical protein
MRSSICCKMAHRGVWPVRCVGYGLAQALGFSFMSWPGASVSACPSSVWALTSCKVLACVRKCGLCVRWQRVQFFPGSCLLCLPHLRLSTPSPPALTSFLVVSLFSSFGFKWPEQLTSLFKAASASTVNEQLVRVGCCVLASVECVRGPRCLRSSLLHVLPSVVLFRVPLAVGPRVLRGCHSIRGQVVRLVFVYCFLCGYTCERGRRSLFCLCRTAVLDTSGDERAGTSSKRCQCVS